LDIIVESLEDDKAVDLNVIDLEGKTSIAGAMVVASGSSARQVSAMADHLSFKLKQAGYKSMIEGEQNADWILIDAFDVIVHIFKPEVREFYNIEKMWMAVANTTRAS
jgi:ribosome-associated protein